VRLGRPVLWVFCGLVGFWLVAPALIVLPLSLTGQAVEWLNELLTPIRSATERLQNVVQRASELKKSLEAA